jgi:hypothetical protein
VDGERFEGLFASIRPFCYIPILILQAEAQVLQETLPGVKVQV